MFFFSSKWSTFCPFLPWSYPDRVSGILELRADSLTVQEALHSSMLGRKGSQDSDIGEEEDLESGELDDAEAGDNEDLEDFDDDDEVRYDFSLVYIYNFIYVLIILHIYIYIWLIYRI